MTPRLEYAISTGGDYAKAYYFAMAAHGAVGQVRKYTGEPYIVHPVEVAGTVLEALGTKNQIVAALLHDVVEDTKVPLNVIYDVFGDGVGKLVNDLTDLYTPEAFPDRSRSTRKQQEAMRYASVSTDAKTIKLADGLSNTPTIALHDPGFMKTYGAEKRVLMESLRGGSRFLWSRLDTMLKGLGY